MKFKTDENLPHEAAELLSGAGHDAVTIGEQGLGGTIDSNIASACQQEGRILVTLDLDFADIRTYPPNRYPGFVVLRLARQDKKNVLKAVDHIVALLSAEPIAGSLWIVEENKVRIHGE